MDIGIETIEADIVPIGYRWHIVQLRLAFLDTMLDTPHKLRPVLVHQLVRLIVAHTLRVYRVFLYALEHELHILQHLPDVVLTGTPSRKGVRQVEHTVGRADQGMKHFTLEGNNLVGDNRSEDGEQCSPAGSCLSPSISYRNGTIVGKSAGQGHGKSEHSAFIHTIADKYNAKPYWKAGKKAEWLPVGALSSWDKRIMCLRKGLSNDGVT